MIETLFNDKLRIAVDSCGAQLISVKTVNGTDLLWTRDPAIWEDSSPVLFPWTGRIKNKAFTKDGKIFKADIHGFIRSVEHCCTKKNAQALRFETSSSDATNKLFPYDFVFAQEFKLDGSILQHRVFVTNTGNQTMPFGLGFHPGFICPFEPGKPANDYAVFFDKKQHLELIEITQNGLPSGKKTAFMRGKDTISLSDDLFKSRSLCFGGFNASTITLREKKPQPTGTRGRLEAIEIEIKDFPFLLLWSAPTEKLKFVCIEPWHTLPDFENSQSEWVTKQNLLRLESGKTFTSELKTTFHIG